MSPININSLKIQTFTFLVHSRNVIILFKNAHKAPRNVSCKLNCHLDLATSSVITKTHFLRDTYTMLCTHAVNYNLWHFRFISKKNRQTCSSNIDLDTNTCSHSANGTLTETNIWEQTCLQISTRSPVLYSMGLWNINASYV